MFQRRYRVLLGFYRVFNSHDLALTIDMILLGSTGFYRVFTEFFFQSITWFFRVISKMNWVAILLTRHYRVLLGFTELFLRHYLVFLSY